MKEHTVLICVQCFRMCNMSCVGLNEIGNDACCISALFYPHLFFFCCICISTVFLVGIVCIALEPGRNDIVAVIAGAVCKVASYKEHSSWSD